MLAFSFIQKKKRISFFKVAAQLALWLNSPNLLLSAGVQPLPVRQRVDASQCLLPEAGGQEVAQHGEPQLY